MKGHTLWFLFIVIHQSSIDLCRSTGIQLKENVGNTVKDKFNNDVTTRETNEDYLNDKIGSTVPDVMAHMDPDDAFYRDLAVQRTVSLIVGLSIGAFTLLSFIIGCILFFCLYRRKKSRPGRILFIKPVQVANEAHEQPGSIGLQSISTTAKSGYPEPAGWK